MKTKEGENELDRVVYGYTADTSALEDENKLLKKTLEQLRLELDRLKSPALMVCELVEQVDKEHAIIKIPNGNEFFVNVSCDCDKLRPGDNVMVEQKNLTVLKKIFVSQKFNVDKFVIIEQPNISWKEIGGLDDEILEVQEVVELPLKKPELFRKMGIDPPRGVLLYGPPGTGKTLLAKAVAASTHSTFIEIVASELVQKFIGEGAKLVNEIFTLARRKAPAIIFIDELDALAATRMETGTSGEREVNRTFMQLLAEIDGFDPLDNVKIVGATNRIDILDPAIIRPGRLDRLIHIKNPSEKGRLEIFKIHSRRMKLNKDIELDKLAKKTDGFSGADIKAVCTEAGYFAIRKNQTQAIKSDFENAVNKVKQEDKEKEHLGMFG